MFFKVVLYLLCFIIMYLGSNRYKFTKNLSVFVNFLYLKKNPVNNGQKNQVSKFFLNKMKKIIRLLQNSIRQKVFYFRH